MFVLSFSLPLPLVSSNPLHFPIPQVLINDRFAQFSEALYVADRHAREEVRQRSLMQQRIAQKEKDAAEENMRVLAQRARGDRTGVVSTTTARVVGATGGEMPAALAGYGSGSESGSEGGREEEEEEEEQEQEGEEDEAAARERETIRRERKKEREREMRMSNMGTEQRAKILAR